MIANPLNKIHLLVLHDELPAMGDPDAERGPVREHLPSDPRLRVTLAKAAYGEALRAARQHHPDVILLDGVLGDPVVLLAELDEAMHGTPLLVILDDTERERTHDCVVAGARGCLVRPVDPNVLVRTIIQLHEKAARHRKQLRLSGEQGGRLIAVRGAKGGVGASLIATNLAVALRRRSGKRVALVDAHFFGGDVPVMLDLVPDRSLADLTAHLHNLDDELVENTLMEHASGVRVLAAPSDFERAEAITPEELQRVLQAFRARFDYVVIDSSPFFDQSSLVVLDLADLLLVVCTPEIPALKNGSRFIQLGFEFGYSETKMRLVVNRVNCPGAIARADFEKHLGYRMSFGIPNDGRAVVGALTKGQPLVTFHKSSGTARAIDRLARAVLTDEGWQGQTGRAASRRSLRLPSLPRLSVLPGLRKQSQEHA